MKFFKIKTKDNEYYFFGQNALNIEEYIKKEKIENIQKVYIGDYNSNNLIRSKLNNVDLINKIGDLKLLRFENSFINNVKLNHINNEYLTIILLENNDIFISSNIFILDTFYHINKKYGDQINFKIIESKYLDFLISIENNEVNIKSLSFDNINDYEKITNNYYLDSVNIYEYKNEEMFCLKQDFNDEILLNYINHYYNIKTGELENKMNDSYLNEYELDL